uniref:Capsid protein n=1 Tax=Murine astrovirus TaxID=1141625 RepID=A0ACD6BAA0_9VIRU|nr:capsid protein [Murine astrovirus]
MAKAKQQHKNATTVTTTTVTGGSSRRSRRRSVRRRAAGPPNPPTKTTTVRTVLRRNTRPRGNRRGSRNAQRQAPREVVQTVTATLGTVGANQGDKVELEMAALLNPALIKETTGSNAFGPLQMYASTHALWKVDRLTLKLTPLVGASAVSGTAVRASLNMTSGPAAPAWSALGARKHVDTNPGRLASLTLTAADIPGPKQGWFLTNTKQEAGFSVGGALEIHTLGKTMSTYQNAAYTGPLFLAEVTGTWRFKNYEPQPGLLNLLKTEVKEPAGTVKIHSKPGEPVTMSIPANTTFAGLERLNVTASATPGEIIWEVADAAATAVTGALPQPWSWLLRGGWWFLKRIANVKAVGSPTVVGEPDGGEVTFRVYASIADAQNDVPCIASSEASTISKETQGMKIQQVTPGTIGMPETAIATHNTLPPVAVDAYVYRGPCQEAADPLHAARYAAWSVVDVHTNHTSPPRWSGVVPDGQTSAWSACTLELPGAFYQGAQEIDPVAAADGTFAVNHWNTTNQKLTRLGTAYGCNQHRARTTGAEFRVISVTSVLWRAEISTGWNYDRFLAKLWNGTILAEPTTSHQDSGIPLTRGGLNWVRSENTVYAYRNQITAGKWYVTFWMTYDPDEWVWLDQFKLQFALHPANWSDPIAPRWDITEDSLGTGLWSLQDLTFYPVGHQPKIVIPPGEPGPSSRVTFDLPSGEEDECYTDEDGESEEGAEDDEGNTLEFDHPLDGDLSQPPAAVLKDLTYKGRNLANEMWSTGVPDAKAWLAGQAIDPSPSFRRWRETFQKALQRGVKPLEARELATSEFLAQRGSRGHAE